MRVVIDLDDFDPHRLADGQNLRRMIDPAPGDIGHMQEPVDAAEIDEGAVIGDVLHHAVDHLAFCEIGDDLMALLGAGFFEHGAARDDDIAAAAVHLQNLEGLRRLHQRGHVADRADIDLAARQESDGAVEIDREAALDLVEDNAFDLFLFLESLFELDPAFLAPRLVARDDRFAERVLDPLKIDLDLVADGKFAFAAGPLKFLEGDAAFGLQTEIDDGDVFFDRDDEALDDGALESLVLGHSFRREARQNPRATARRCWWMPFVLLSCPNAGGAGVLGRWRFCPPAFAAVRQTTTRKRAGARTAERSRV